MSNVSVSTHIIQKLNSALGITGRPHHILDNGEWLDTGCLEWPQSPSLQEIWAGISSELIDAIQRSQEFLQQEYTNDIAEKTTEFFSNEPSHIQAEYADFITKLEKANSPFGNLPSMPEYSQDLKDAQERIAQRLNEEKFLNGDEFDIDRYLARMRELFAQEPPHIQSEVAELTARAKEISNLAQRANRQRRRTLKQVRDLLKDEPVLAYRAGIEWEGSPSTTYSTIVVIPSTDQFGILRTEKTNGANHGLLTEDLIENLRMLDEKYGIDIVGACIDGVEIQLKRVLKGKEAQELGKWLLELCPDLYEAPKSFPKGKVVLWWD